MTEQPPLPEPDGVVSAVWDLVRSGPNFDGRDRQVIAAAKAYAQRYGKACADAERERIADLWAGCYTEAEGHGMVDIGASIRSGRLVDEK